MGVAVDRLYVAAQRFPKRTQSFGGGAEKVFIRCAQNVACRIEFFHYARDVTGPEHRELARIGSEDFVQIHEHGRTVGGGRGPVRVGFDVFPERDREPVSLVRPRRKLPARRDHRSAPLGEERCHGDLPLQPGRDRLSHLRHARRHTRYHRGRTKMHHQREEVVEYDRLLDAKPVLPRERHRRFHRAPRSFLAAHALVSSVRHPISLLRPSANNIPFSARARRISPPAFGPTPWSFNISASLTSVSCSSRVYPASASAPRAGLPTPRGRSLFVSSPLTRLHLPPARRGTRRSSARGDRRGRASRSLGG